MRALNRSATPGTATAHRADVQAFIAAQLGDPAASWAIGTFGAIGEFLVNAGEPVSVRAHGPVASAVSARGGIALAALPDTRPIALESPAGADGWHAEVAFCLGLQSRRMPIRRVVTELGADREALRPEDRGAPMFDLGLAIPHVRFCVRSRDPEVIGLLRDAAGQPLLRPGNALGRALASHNPHRVVLSALGRVEIFAPIAAPGTRTAEGPHTHLLPPLLAKRDAMERARPIDRALRACAQVFPAHPLHGSAGESRPFDASAHRRFQSVFDRFGIPAAIDAKQWVTKAVRDGRPPPPSLPFRSAQARASGVVGLRQLFHAGGVDADCLAAWRTRFDQPAKTRGHET
jgi:hypothetical protein